MMPRTQGGALTDWLDASPPDRNSALDACRECIRDREDSIRAWAHVNPQPPLAEGPLSGIPFGVKDSIDTRDLPTGWGSPIYRGRTAPADAAIVQDLRRRGAVLLGKTHTTAFAFRDPAPTRNPHHLEHTPGGSSSGSAAAVAANMVPLALGTQTLGSVLRPASYCGVTGFKPTFGVLPLDGVLPFAQSLDTLGFFTRTPGDMQRLWEALGHPPAPEEDIVFGVPDDLPEAEPEMIAAFEGALAAIRHAGLPAQKIEIAKMLTGLADSTETVMVYEGARFHRERFEKYGEQLGAVAAVVKRGLEIGDARYAEAIEFIGVCRMRMAEIYRRTPAILVPAATGPAPRGLGYTGNARMNSPWTALGTPAISVPMAAGDGLPLGLQVTAAPGEDARVLRAAEIVHRVVQSR